MGLFKTFRKSRTCLLVLFLFLASDVLVLMVWNSRRSLTITTLKENFEYLEKRFGKDIVTRNESMDRSVNSRVGNYTNKTRTTSGDVEYGAKRMFVLPLNFSKSPVKNSKNLTELLETPAKPPVGPPRGVPMDKMPYMMDPRYKPPDCPKTLSTISRYSRWFKERFRPGLKMFLDEQDVYNFTNYFKIAHYGMPFGYRSVDRNILGSIVNNPNFTNAPITKLTDRCVRCAVVGNGGILNGSNAGQEIDSHDFVFRLNRALTKGRFAADVGRKTSFYEFFPESQNVGTVDDPNAAFIFTPFKSVDLYYADSMLRGNTSSRYFNVDGKIKKFTKPPLLDTKRLKITHPDFFRYVFTHFLDLKGHRPTTGALLAFAAIYMCDEVNIYGFGFHPQFTVHYYDNKFKKVTKYSTGTHDVNNERNIWSKLHSEGVIKLFKRDF